MTIKEDIAMMKLMTIKLDPRWQNGCEICHINRRKGMTFHHIKYRNINYKNFPKNGKGRLAYARAIYQEAQTEPERLMYLCHKHHMAVEAMLRYSWDTWNRLTEIKKLHETTGASA